MVKSQVKAVVILKSSFTMSQHGGGSKLLVQLSMTANCHQNLGKTISSQNIARWLMTTLLDLALLLMNC
jgi:hypothetical protein